eukprot:3381718-Pleurochrysis_carterae.AAC.1
MHDQTSHEGQQLPAKVSMQSLICAPVFCDDLLHPYPHPKRSVTLKVGISLPRFDMAAAKDV